MLATSTLDLLQAVEPIAEAAFSPLPLILASTVAVVIIGTGSVFVMLARERKMREQQREERRQPRE